MFIFYCIHRVNLLIFIIIVILKINHIKTVKEFTPLYNHTASHNPDQVQFR